MSTTRRDFVKQSGSAVVAATALAGTAPHVWAKNKDAKPAKKPTLICVYLRGGSDPLSTIVPWSDPLYYEHRPTIYIPHKDEGADRPGVIKLNKYFGFHPAMKELHALYEKGMMAPIINVGSPHPTRSHFDAQDFMERAAPGIRSVTEGWLNRYLYETRSQDDSLLRAFALQPKLPRSMRGQFPVLAAPVGGSAASMDVFETLYGCPEDMRMQEKAAEEGNLQQRLFKSDVAENQKRAMLLANSRRMREKYGTPEAIVGKEAHSTIITAGDTTIKAFRELQGVLHTAPGGGYPGGHLARQFQNIAKVIKADAGLEVAAIDYGGWDHHAYQGDVEGKFADMIGNVSQSIGAFVNDLGEERMKNVLVLTMSEFGRTVRENGNTGSDHGHGGFMMAIGGMVKGGNIYGKWTGLEKDQLYHGRDMPAHTDFRDVFMETLARLFRFDSLKTNFFPEYRPNRPLGFLNQVV